MSSNNDTHNLTQMELNKQTKKDIKEVLNILKNLNNDVRDLKTEIDVIKKDMYFKTNDDATINKLESFEKKLKANEEISQRTLGLVNNLQSQSKNDSNVRNVSRNGPGQTRAIDTSSVLESNVIQYIEYQVNNKVDVKFENVNNEIKNIKNETNVLNSKIVSVAKSISNKK